MPIAIYQNIRELLGSYQSLETETRLELDRVVESSLINGTQLQIIFCLFNVGLNVVETAELLGLGAGEFQEEYEELIEVFEASLNGYKTKRERKLGCGSHAESINHLLTLFSLGKVNPFAPMNERVRHSLLLLYNDELAKETVRQKVHGKPQFEADNNYNFYMVDDLYELGVRKPTTGSDTFVKQYYQNNVSFENLYNFVPSKDLAGRKKTHFKSDDSITGGKQNLY